MGTVRNSHTATLLPDGRVLVAGGWDGANMLASAELYDPRAQVWAPTGAMSVTRAYHSATLLPNGQVLIAGGWDSNGAALASAELYDAGTGLWSAAGAMSLARAGHTATLLPNGKVLVAGGDRGDTRASAELYDPATNSWTPAGVMGASRSWHTATLLPKGQVLVAGGWDRSHQPLANAEQYDPAANTWKPAAALAAARLDHTATLLPDGSVLFVGGYNGSYLAGAELYDASADAWSSAGSMSSARAYHAAILLRDGTVLAAGGANGSRPSASAELYDPHTKTWTSAGALPAAYESYLAILLSDGKVLITGRPGSSDPTGNGGVPTPPGGAQGSLPPSTPWSRQPTSTPPPSTGNTASARGEVALNAFRAAGESIAAVTPVPTPIGNFTTGAGTARLYGVHEVSFTLPLTTNPHAIPVTVTFTSQLVPSAATTVTAFYDGPGQPNEDLWKARIYVNRVGTWSWTASTGQTGSFAAIEQPEAGLHGMLRAVSETQTIAITITPANPTLTESRAEHVGTPKRWYTDDGRTFLPMADTAYLLFFQRPITSTPASPSGCPPGRDSAQFVTDYAADVVSHGVNVLRVEVLGTWAYQGTNTNPPPPTPPTTGCVTDLSLFWSRSKDGSNDDLFNGAPSFTELITPTVTFYPNLKSFQNADEKLKLLLNQYPGVYVQMLLLPDHWYNPNDSDPDYRSSENWRDINGVLKEQLWKTMIARWAAFPNVFWSISNDISDDDSARPNMPAYWSKQPNGHFAREIGCYFGGDGSSSACASVKAHDPWNQPEGPRRPMSLGHLREVEDNYVKGTATPVAPWHTYITAYSYSDLSAQQMDGTTPLPQPSFVWPIGNGVYSYAYESKPAFNTEDRYEGNFHGDSKPKEVEYPDYYFRRLFWSYLLSGGGATYGADPTWMGLHTYSTGWYTYTVVVNSTPIAYTSTLVGLNGVRSIPGVLDSARVDLALFRPQDALITKSGNPDWAEFNRAQVARRGSKEILAYIPNTSPLTTPDADGRRKAAVATTIATVSVNMSEFTDPNYVVTWYNPQGTPQPTSVITGNPTPGATVTRILTPSFGGDAVLHISSRCTSPNVCLSMDSETTDYIYPRSKDGFQVHLGGLAGVTATLSSDSVQRVFGDASWRCDRPIDAPQWEDHYNCLLQYAFPFTKTVATVDYYLRRNSRSAFQGVGVAASMSPTQPITDWNTLFEIWAGFNPEGDLFSEVYEEGAWSQLDVRHGVPLASNRWYHVALSVTKTVNAQPGTFAAAVFLDGSLVYTKSVQFARGDVFMRGAEVYTSWWGPIYELDDDTTPSVWWDELSIDPPPDTDLRGLYRTFLQQGLGNYAGNKATWFDYSGGYNDTNLLHVGANNGVKSLLRFDLANIPAGAIVDEATLQVYYTGRSNANTLTLGAHRVLADWVDSQANRVQRKTGVNWQVAGMGSGSDYTATAEATANITGAGGAWIELDVTNAAQAWVSNAASNHGLVLLQEAASGSVIYDFCSELRWSPCTATQAPRLTLRYHLAPPPPVKATFQQGVGGYAGANATWFDYSGGYDYTSLLHVGANNGTKSLLRFDVTSIPANATVDEATLRLYYTGRSNSNSLTLGAHGVLAEWIDSQANRVQRKTGVNWQVAGMGSGSDYVAAADGTADVLGAGGSWVELDVTDLTQAWVTNATNNHGVVLLQEAASGSVVYDFCSELGWSPCSAAQAPKLTIWYRQ